MEIRDLKVSELIPYEHNPRINDSAVGAVVESIREYGFKQPIVVDSNRVVIAGHTRLKAAKKLGMETVPVLVADDLSPDKVKTYRIADNRTGELAEWDFDALKEELEDLEKLGADLSLEAFNFEEDFNKHEQKQKRKENNPRDIPKADELVIEDEILEDLRKEKVIFSLSGGQDSSTAVYCVAPYLKEHGVDFELVYVDTGVELPGVEDYVIRFAEHFGYPLKILRDGPSFFSYYEKKKSFPNAIYRDCIMALIGDPIDRYLKSRLSEGQSGVDIRGGRNNQATDMSRGKKYYKNNNGVKLFNPLWDLSEEAFQGYRDRLKAEFGLWEGYDRGFVRTACWCCPFQTVQQYDVIRKELPLCFDILRRKAKEWRFWGSTHLDRYLKSHADELKD